MSLSLDIIQNVFTAKRWVNESRYCNRRTHPISFNYRGYKRGKGRCVVCGAKIGSISCKWQSISDQAMENYFKRSELLFGLLKNE